MRSKEIIKVSFISILVNIFLSLFKIIIGVVSNSIAIVLDAINNLTDALSSLVTIVGTKLALKLPDKKHPYGYGRVEYLSASIIAIIVSYAGINSLIESVKKIITPVNPNYSNITLLILIIAIFTKIILGSYVKSKGKKYNSESLINSGKDALLDSLISLSTLIAALVFLIFKIKLEAYLGVFISIIIIKSGFDMLKKTISQILGERVDKNVSNEVKKIVNSFSEVNGIYDLILNNYGPDIYMGSFHIEVSEKLKATQIDHLTRKITKKVFEQTNVIVTAVGIYTSNDEDEKSKKIKKDIIEIIKKYKSIIQMHGFYVNKEEKDINLDLIFDFNEKDKMKTYKLIYEEIKNKYNNYNIYIAIDVDISD